MTYRNRGSTTSREHNPFMNSSRASFIPSYEFRLISIVRILKQSVPDWRIGTGVHKLINEAVTWLVCIDDSDGDANLVTRFVLTISCV